jgi:GDPmannose 4,6-dehydratase
MLQQDQPADYILASGVGHTVREFAERAFSHVSLRAEDHIRVDPGLVRMRDSTTQVGDATLARQRLGWRPGLSFEQLIARMVDADLHELQLVRQPYQAR